MPLLLPSACFPNAESKLASSSPMCYTTIQHTTPYRTPESAIVYVRSEQDDRSCRAEDWQLPLGAPAGPGRLCRGLPSRASLFRLVCSNQTTLRACRTG